MNNKFLDEIPQDMFYDLKLIGSGSFSDIFSATHVKTNTKVALKISFKTNNEEEMKVIDQEISVNKTLHHPFICKFFTSLETEHLKIIVMEIIEGITALDYVNKTGGLQISEARDIFTQLIIAIEYLHTEVFITHRDLKLENIMIDNYGHIRLIDFGFSSMNTMMTTCCGSIPYCAPEILSGQVYNKESDIWSMGIILYALIDGNLPFFHTNIKVLAEIVCNRDITYSQSFDPIVQDLLNKMLTKAPEQRITIEEIKLHPFVSHEKLLQINYKQLFLPSIPAKQSFPQLYTSDNNLPLMNRPIEKVESSNFVRYSPNLVFAANLTTQRRKSHCVKSSNFPFLLPPPNHEVLHNRITQKIDNVDLLIQNRKNFDYYLNLLIESAIKDNSIKIDHSNQVHFACSPHKSSKIHFSVLNSTYNRRGSHSHAFFNQISKETPIVKPASNQIPINNNNFCEEQ